MRFQTSREREGHRAAQKAATARKQKDVSKASRDLSSMTPSSRAERLFCQPAPQLQLEGMLPAESPSIALDPTY